MIRPSGCARYSATVLKAYACVPDKARAGDGRAKQSGNTESNPSLRKKGWIFCLSQLMTVLTGGQYSMDIRTLCIHAGDDPADATGAVSVPIYQTATFAHPALGESTGYDYSRVQNPTRAHLEKAVAALEHGTDCLAFTSGMAAISLLMELFRPGDEILSSDDLYGGSIRLFRSVSEKNGLHFQFFDTSRTAELDNHFTPSVKALYLETPTNPMMHASDIRQAAETAHRHGAILIVDNTFMTPYFQNPLDLGADIVIHSGTKYLGGHNDTLAGFLVTSSSALSEKLRYLYKTIGSCLAPFDSWLILRGLKTLAVRMEAQQKTAGILAEWLSRQSRVTSVLYPGLPCYADKEIHFRQARGAGAMLSFTVDTPETAASILSSVSVIRFAESLGGTETLITYPATQTHSDLSEEERNARGITNCLLRLSVGLEAADDLIADLSQAMK